jgi:two-component sensor histidine kinase
MGGDRIDPLGHWLRRWPPALVEAAVALSAVALAVGGRLLLDSFVSGAVPFALVFPCAIGAGLIAGFRAGLATVAVCQLLVWYFVMPPARTFELDPGQTASLLLTTIAELIAVWAVTSYRRAAITLRAEQARRVDMLQLALREIDHRTKNNFHIAASLLTAQAATTADDGAAAELRLAASRLMSIAGTYKNLALSSANLSNVLLHEHLREICDQLRGGMLPEAVALRFDAAPATVTAEAAVAIGLIVNEWITNAAKHAFAGGNGEIVVGVVREGPDLIVTVADNGPGIDDSRQSGSGSRLTATLARSIPARLEVVSRAGTRCTLRLAAVE